MYGKEGRIAKRDISTFYHRNAGFQWVCHLIACSSVYEQ